MNIAIVGSSGYISQFMLNKFKKNPSLDEILKIDQTEDADFYLELTKSDDFNYSILDNIEYVIFTAAISSPDKCESEYDYCWNVNVTGTEKFIKSAMQHNCKVLFFSSDAVFGDIGAKIYDEKSETCAKTAYGIMKKHVEDTFKGEKMFKAIRLSYVASARDRFVSYCLKCIENNEVADVFHPFYRNCISVTDVVNVVEWLMFNWNNFEPYVLNIAGKELVSRIRIADEINRILGNKLKYNVSFPGEAFYKNRPEITQMISLYLEDYKIIKNNTFTEKMKLELEDIKI